MINVNTLDDLFKERYKKLNQDQKKAVDTIDGPLLVVAGPGSGKTEILGMRVAQILRQTDVRPSNILCLTFTESATLNMRDRLVKLIGDRAYQVSVHTFHNFCVDIIRKHGQYFYRGATFSPADEISQISILESLLRVLPFHHPLSGYHPEEGYTYLQAIRGAIANTKRAGILPEEFEVILKDNEAGFTAIEEVLLPVLDKRLGKGSVDELESELKKFIDSSAKDAKQRHAHLVKSKPELKHIFTVYKPIEESFALSLAETLAKARQDESNDALSAWKAKWFKKDDSGKKVFRDRLNLEKLLAFADIYKVYQSQMYNSGFFDFDDMILDVIKALETTPELRYAIQEQFQYVLVDEFQDTNNAQMRILSLITDAPEHNGRPNIMVVGDDDQAIYKFQGAELSNILDFSHNYQDTAMVTLTHNYRSTQAILDIAMRIIRKGEKRLENLIPDLSKQLIAKGELAEGSIKQVVLETALHEYKYIANEITSLINTQSINPKDIAIIARKHGQLEEIVPYLREENIPIKYEREQNVFDEPHINELITIATFVSSIVTPHSYEVVRDDLLPEILSYTFWGVKRVDVWRISLEAKKQSKTWLEVMCESENILIKNIADFLINLGTDAKSTPLEKIIDRMIGVHVDVLSPHPDDSDNNQDEITQLVTEDKNNFSSPFRDFYFSKSRFENSRAEYLSFLSSLRVFIQALRDYNGELSSAESNKKHILYLDDMVKFVEIYRKNGIRLNDKSPFVTARNAVELMSAHSAKGLEFKVVFVLSCQDEVWAGRGRGNKLPFPINIPIEPAGENEDDQLRLFYVAITRAKEHLYLTSHQVKESGKEANGLRFLVGSEGSEFIKSNKDPSLITPQLLELTMRGYRDTTFVDDEGALLRSLIQNYALSVTHLNNFLNVPKGGPMYFFEQNLLRFPQSKSVSGAYGSAMHSTLEFVLHEAKQKGQSTINIDVAEQAFELFLKKQKIDPENSSLLLERGKRSLKAFLKSDVMNIGPQDIAELDFGREHIQVGEARITGKIDRVKVNCGVQGEINAIEIHDYKTGKIIGDISDPDAKDILKAHQYRNQLMFYALLISHSSRRFDVPFRDIDVSSMNGVIDFVEPALGKDTIESRTLYFSECDLVRFLNLVKAVYRRIVNLEFDLPEPIERSRREGVYKNDYEAIQAFEDYLIEEEVLRGAN